MSLLLALDVSLIGEDGGARLAGHHLTPVIGFGE